MKFIYEVRPCVEEEDCMVFECLPEEAEFWGVYKRPVEGGPAEWVDDFASEYGANLHAVRLQARELA